MKEKEISEKCRRAAEEVKRVAGVVREVRLFGTELSFPEIDMRIVLVVNPVDELSARCTSESEPLRRIILR